MRITNSHTNRSDDYPTSHLEVKEFPSNLNRASSIGKITLPMKSLAHRDRGRVNYTVSNQPKICKLVADKASKTAFDILRYQLKDRNARQIHWNNLKQNLQHRLKSAQAQGNTELMTRLSKEFRELNSLKQL